MLEHNLYEGWKSISSEIHVYFVADTIEFQKHKKTLMDIAALKMIVNLIWMSIR